MNDLEQNLVWVDITSDFSPVDYANTFAEDAVVEQLGGLESPEEQLLCLYENGYLSKRDGKIKFLLPEDALDEADKPGYMSRMKAGASKMAAGAKDYGKRAKSAYQWSRAQGSGKMASAGKVAKAAMQSAPKGVKIAGGALAVAAAAKGAHSLYKRMKARKAKKRAMQASLDQDDLDLIMTDSKELGFTFDSYDDLLETLQVGSDLDILIKDFVDDEELAENLDEAAESEVIECVLSELDEGDTATISNLKWDGKVEEPLAEMGCDDDEDKKDKKDKKKKMDYDEDDPEYKKMKKKDKSESREFTGYRSSASGGVYESGPVPFGTGNKLYERINKNLLNTTLGQELINKVTL